MEHVEAVADEVASWTYKEGADAVLRLRDGRELIARQSDSRFKSWSRAMAFQQEKHWPVYVEFDPATRSIDMLLLCTPYEVESMQPQATGDITVVFRRAPSYYVLKKDRPEHDAILAMLTSAMQSGAILLIAVQPTTLEILCAFPSR